MRNGPQLIAYADRVGGDLNRLHQLLEHEFGGAFDGVHVLPFYLPIDGADAGFDPTDHTAVDPRLGTWADLAQLATSREVMADLIVNHVSADSEPFRDWLRQGSNSVFAGMFLTFDSVFAGGATEADLAAVYRPRPGLPFTRIRLHDGTLRLAWTTFTPQQIDIDVEHPLGWQYLISIIDQLATAGVSLVRLDAVGYGVKRAGTSCFMIPETYEFIDRLTDELHARDMTVLVEIHSHHQVQIEIASRVDLVYDFALPPLVLDALYQGRSDALRQWIRIRPDNAINVLDTHDGIGVIDVGADPTDPSRPGLLDPQRLEALVEGIHDRSGGGSRLATGAAASNLDLYQVNCTYYDALGRDDSRYLIARLIQCVLPGIPQIYYVGLLGGTNDMAELERTGVGRDVNRHRYSPDEVESALNRPVVRSLLSLLRWRNDNPVFDGVFSLLDAGDHELRIRWEHDVGETRTVDVVIDLVQASFSLSESGPGTTRTVISMHEL